MAVRYTKEVLEEAVRQSTSTSEVLRRLGVRHSGGMYNFIASKIKRFGINISHYKMWNKGVSGLTSLGYKKPKDVLVVLPESRKTGQHAHILRRALIESGRKNICEFCGISSVWNGKELRMEIDHKNGNTFDNRSENLRILCPNCHSQTDTFRNYKKGKKNKS